MVSNWQIQQAARVVRHGGVIAYPTEAVWGLGCDPWNDEAVERLLALKERPVHKGLILVAADIEQFDFLLDDLANPFEKPGVVFRDRVELGDVETLAHGLGGNEQAVRRGHGQGCLDIFLRRTVK